MLSLKQDKSIRIDHDTYINISLCYPLSRTNQYVLIMILISTYRCAIPGAGQINRYWSWYSYQHIVVLSPEQDKSIRIDHDTLINISLCCPLSRTSEPPSTPPHPAVSPPGAAVPRPDLRDPLRVHRVREHVPGQGQPGGPAGPRAPLHLDPQQLAGLHRPLRRRWAARGFLSHQVDVCCMIQRAF